MKPDLDVGIVGGGPCGLFAALLLARAGLRAGLFEKNQALSSHPKAMGLTRRTLEIFRQAGLEAEIAKGCLPLDGRALAVWSKGLAGEELGRVPFAEVHGAVSPCGPAHCPQTWTERTIYAALSQESRAVVAFASAVESVTDVGDHVRIRADGRDHTARYVIAADGAGSPVRKALGIATDGPGDMGHFLNVMFRADLGDVLRGREALLYNALGADFYEFFVAVDGCHTWLMHHFLMPGERAGDFSGDDLRALAVKASGIPGLEVEILGVSPWVMSPKVAKSWRDGRIFLAGDAAARLSPAGGLGLNNGIQSVHNLAWKLAAVCRGRAAESLLDTYEEERKPCAHKLMAGTNKNADEIFSVIAAAMRGDWADAKEMIAHSRRAGAGLGFDIGLAYESGAFLSDGTTPRVPADPDNDYLANARPGSRMPHAGMLSGSTLDLVRDDFVVLAGRSGGAWMARAGCDCLVNGRDFDAPDFEAVCGISSSGCILVRPDGYVGARFADSAAGESPARAIAAITRTAGTGVGHF